MKSKLITKILAGINIITLWLKFNDMILAKLIDKYPVVNNRVIPLKKGLLYQLPELKIGISLQKHLFLIQSYAMIRKLIENTDIKFSINDKNEVMVNINNINLYISTYEDIYILKEIFVDGVYSLNTRNICYVIDIGMNVSIATLYFSNMENVKKVVSYEPFLRTYEQGLRNIALNPTLQTKIETNNYGIGYCEKDLIVDYNYECKASLGINATNVEIGNKNVTKEQIHISDVNKVFKKISDGVINIDIVVKIDCEGSEYGIIDSLAKHDNLKKIKVFMIEWHDRGPDEIIEALSAAGFITFSTKTNDRIGMIYAVK